MWSVKTFCELQQDERANPGWRQVGSLRIALCEERVDEFKRLKATADQAGLTTNFIDTAEARRLWPAMDFDRARAVLWCPTDGYLQPYDLTMAYVAHARREGVRFQVGTVTRRILVRDGRVTGIVSSMDVVHAIAQDKLA